MARQKMPPSYFLTRIKSFYDKNGFAPRSSDFNGPFHQNVMKYFGSWSAAVKQATGIALNGGRQSNDELLAPIKELFAASKQVPPIDSLGKKNVIAKRFGDYNTAVEMATGVNMKRSVLIALDNLTSGRVDRATLHEIVDELNKTIVLDMNQARAAIMSCIATGDAVMARGDRLCLYMITRTGRESIKKQK